MYNIFELTLGETALQLATGEGHKAIADYLYRVQQDPSIIHKKVKDGKIKIYISIYHFYKYILFLYQCIYLSI